VKTSLGASRHYSRAVSFILTCHSSRRRMSHHTLRGERLIQVSSGEPSLAERARNSHFQIFIVYKFCCKDLFVHFLSGTKYLKKKTIRIWNSRGISTRPVYNYCQKYEIWIVKFRRILWAQSRNVTLCPQPWRSNRMSAPYICC
jgi:hypothetical protein